MFAYSDQLSSRTMQHVDDLRRDANHARVVREARKHATTPARWRRLRLALPTRRTTFDTPTTSPAL